MKLERVLIKSDRRRLVSGLHCGEERSLPNVRQFALDRLGPPSERTKFNEILLTRCSDAAVALECFLFTLYAAQMRLLATLSYCFSAERRHLDPVHYQQHGSNIESLKGGSYRLFLCIA